MLVAIRWTGGAGADRFSGTKDELNGDTITDFALGDTIIIQDAMLAGFTFSLVGNTLTYTGGSLTLEGSLTGTLIASANATGGVALSLTAGTAGDDVLTGTDQDDVLNGLGGNDVISGLGGSDTLTGGSGNDSFLGTAAEFNGDTITDFSVGDTIIISDANLASFNFGMVGNTLVYTGGSFTLQGPLAGDLVASAAPGGGVQLALGPNQTITGTEQADLIDGYDGNDTINGLGGNDLLAGGDGADVVNGGAGEDQIGGGRFIGDVVANGVAPDNALDHDVLSGGDDNDYIWAGYGDDVNGGTGTDSLIYSFGGLASGVTVNTADIVAGQPKVFAGGTIENVENLIQVWGTDFSDTITVATQNAWLDVHGGGGDDVVIAQDSVVGLIGGEGNDRLVSGSAADTFYGETGIDTIDYQNAASGVSVTLGNPGIWGSGTGGDTMLDVEDAFGSGFGDTLTGANGANLLKGMAGNDLLSGGDGDDVLEGGLGDDAIDGGNGVDVASYAGATSGVTVNLGTVAGQDTFGDGTDTLVNIESLTGSAFADQLTGNAGANTLTGNAGNDVLDGGAGADTLIGGADNDTYVVDNAGDLVTENANEGTDTVNASVSYALAANIENLTLTGSAAINGTGNALNNAITGNAAANVLDGGAGADILSGGARRRHLRGRQCCGRGDGEPQRGHRLGQRLGELRRSPTTSRTSR